MSRTILVFGASGTIGQGLLKASLEQADIKLVGVFRSEESAQKVATRLGNPSEGKFVPVIGTLNSEQEAAELQKNVLDRIGSYTDIVNCIGGPPPGLMPLLQVSLDQLRSVTSSGKLDPHFLAAKYFLPPIQDKPGTSFTVINGRGDIEVPTMGHLVIGSAALATMVKYLMIELKDKPVRINEVAVSTMVTPWDNPSVTIPGLSGSPQTDNINMGKALLGVITQAKCKGETIAVTADNVQKVAEEGTM